MSEVFENEAVQTVEPQQTLAQLIQPARGKDEKYEDYVVRRRSANKVLKEYLRGKVQVS
jgi:hypothetical protein